jgi:hypothetical protein
MLLNLSDWVGTTTSASREPCDFLPPPTVHDKHHYQESESAEDQSAFDMAVDGPVLLKSADLGSGPEGSRTQHMAMEGSPTREAHDPVEKEEEEIPVDEHIILEFPPFSPCSAISSSPSLRPSNIEQVTPEGYHKHEHEWSSSTSSPLQFSRINRGSITFPPLPSPPPLHAADASITIRRRNRRPPTSPLPTVSLVVESETERIFDSTVEASPSALYYSALAHRLSLSLSKDYFHKKIVEWTGPCCSMHKIERDELPFLFINSSHHSEEDGTSMAIITSDQIGLGFAGKFHEPGVELPQVDIDKIGEIVGIDTAKDRQINQGQFFHSLTTHHW